MVAGLNQPGVYRRSADGRLGPFAGATARARSPLHAVSALAVAGDGTVYAGDRATGEVYRVRRGSPPEPLTGSALEVPSGLAIDPQGDLIVCDLRLGLVARIPRQGGPPEALARVAAPRGVALGRSGEVGVLSMGPDQLVRVDKGGEIQPLVKGRPFRFPIAIVRDRDRERYLVSDSYAATIWSVNDSGEARPWFRGKPLVRPEGLDFDPDGRLLVADPGAGLVFRFEARIGSSP